MNLTENTLHAFLGIDNLTKGLALKIINNLYSQTHNEMVFNISQLKFNFNATIVLLSYYIEDPEYPEAEYTFKAFEKILTQYIAG